MIRRPPRSTHCISSAASDVYKRQDGEKEGMAFKIMQTVQDMLDDYALQCKSTSSSESREGKKTSQQDNKPFQYQLSEFASKINKEKERQKQGIVLKYVRFNLELPPLDDPEELKYRKVDKPSRSRYRNEFEEVKKLRKHLYLVKNKMDYLTYAIRKVRTGVSVDKSGDESEA
eukprot:TRINITY_DN8675_c0_g2_i1.p1 TRINITY_DN8675_c0_g2~~TRINITY_DN8675_c0_g2_i1.p1  ORF type:complete len:180 (-),score=67.34 TRINITY_DN8675_c0_g2_i1:925-1443(-)